MFDDSRMPATAPAPRDAFGIYRVSLVCLGNICRSPMAEVVLRAELDQVGLSGLVEVDSAGTGDWHIGGPMDAGARAELGRQGYDGSGHQARQFQPSWFERYDLVAAMDETNLWRLRAIAPKSVEAERILLFTRFDPERVGHRNGLEAGVPDPYGEGEEHFALAFELIQGASRGLAEQLAELLAGRTAASARPPR